MRSGSLRRAVGQRYAGEPVPLLSASAVSILTPALRVRRTGAAIGDLQQEGSLLVVERADRRQLTLQPEMGMIEASGVV